MQIGDNLMINNKQFHHLDTIVKEEYSNIVGLSISKNGFILYEKYFNNYSKEDTIHIASATKSIVSILIGIAIEKGYITSVKQNVLDFFPAYRIKRGEKTIQTISIENLITMTAPYKYKYEPYSKVYSSEDWTKAALDLLGGKGSVGEFNYSTVGTHILSGILTHATGMSVLEFASEYLFKPLEIEVPNHVMLENREAYMSFIKDKYVNGWIIEDNHHQGYAALGDGGNVIYVCPSKGLVVAIASSFKARVKDRIELIKKYILTEV